MWLHGLQHARLPCPSLSPGVCSDSRPLSQWCRPTVSSSVALFSCPQSFPASGSFPRSTLIVQVWGAPLSPHKTWSRKFQPHNMAASFSTKWLALHTGLYLQGLVWGPKQTWTANESHYLIKLSSIWLHNKITLDSRWIKQKGYWSFIPRNSTSYWSRVSLGITVY